MGVTTDPSMMLVLRNVVDQPVIGSESPVEAQPEPTAVQIEAETTMELMPLVIDIEEEAKVLGGDPDRHVVPFDDGKWAIKQQGNSSPLAIFENKKDAEQLATLMCKATKGEKFIHEKNGKIQRRDSYGNDPHGGG